MERGHKSKNVKKKEFQNQEKHDDNLYYNYDVYEEKLLYLLEISLIISNKFLK